MLFLAHRRQQFVCNVNYNSETFHTWWNPQWNCPEPACAHFPSTLRAGGSGPPEKLCIMNVCVWDGPSSSPNYNTHFKKMMQNNYLFHSPEWVRSAVQLKKGKDFKRIYSESAKKYLHRSSRVKLIKIYNATYECRGRASAAGFPEVIFDAGGQKANQHLPPPLHQEFSAVSKLYPRVLRSRHKINTHTGLNLT